MLLNPVHMLGTVLSGRDRAVTPWSSRAVQEMTKSIIVSHSANFPCRCRGHPITFLFLCDTHTVPFYPEFPLHLETPCLPVNMDLLTR